MVLESEMKWVTKAPCYGGRRTLLEDRQYSVILVLQGLNCGVIGGGGGLEEGRKVCPGQGRGKLHPPAESTEERLWARKPVTGK